MILSDAMVIPETQGLITRRRDQMNAKVPPSMDIEEENTNGFSIGDLLRTSRNRRDEELCEVSEALRIRRVYLEALENNKFEELPGAIYAIGFIRTYAEYLGLDAEEVVRHYKSEETSLESKQNLTFPYLVPEHGIPGGAIVMLGLVLAAIGYGSWYYVSTKNIFVTEQVSAVPEKLAAVVGEKPVATEPIKTDEEQTTAANAMPVEKSGKKSEDQAAAKPEETPEQKPAKTEQNGFEESSPESVKTEKIIKDAAQPVEKKIKKILEKVPEKVNIKTEDKVDEIKKVVAKTPVEPKPEPVQETVKVETTKPAAPLSPEVASKKLADEPFKQEIAKKPKAPASIPPPKKKVEPKVEQVAEKVIEKIEAKTPIAEPVAETKVEPAPESEPEPKPEVKTKPAPEVAALPEPKPATGNSRITLRAITDCYIQVRDNDSDQLLITRLLKKGDSYNVPNRTGLSLITANAGALEILVDGTAVPSIGPIGAFRRNVLLEAEKLIDGSAIIE